MAAQVDRAHLKSGTEVDEAKSLYTNYDATLGIHYDHVSTGAPPSQSAAERCDVVRMGFVKSFGGLVAARFFLGLAESGTCHSRKMFEQCLRKGD